MKNFLSNTGLRRLDHLPRNRAIVLGLVIGAVLAGYFTSQTLWVSTGGYLLVLSLAALLAYSGEPVAVSVEDDENQDWATIPGGHFFRSDGQSEHKVTISPFKCMRTTVTRGLYRAVMEQTSETAEDDTGNDLPVIDVSWFDAVRFCNHWSEQAGLTPCYEVLNNTTVIWHSQRDGYRLLTEAEWEYACRAGSEGTWCFGDKETKLTEYAWFEDNSDDTLHSVRQKKPNDWGLYDMHGNVWEWCWDWHDDYSSKTVTDPIGTETGTMRVLRGGAFDDEAWLLCSANRYWYLPEYQDWYIGFRCARGPRRQP